LITLMVALFPEFMAKAFGIGIVAILFVPACP